MGERAIVEGRWTVSPGLDLGMFIIRTLGGERIAVTRSEAVARLIEAAPDLLAACKEFVRKVEAGEAKSTRSYDQMKAAIAKVEVIPHGNGG